jgi:hypothetical protein
MAPQIRRTREPYPSTPPDPPGLHIRDGPVSPVMQEVCNRCMGVMRVVIEAGLPKPLGFPLFTSLSP